MNHLSLFIVGSGHIFISDIPIFSKSIKCRIEVLCRWEKIASAGMIQLRFQVLFYLFRLEYLNDLLSLDNVPVGSVDAEPVYRLIAVIMSEVKRSQERIKRFVIVVQTKKCIIAAKHLCILTNYSLRLDIYVCFLYNKISKYTMCTKVHIAYRGID